MVLLLDEMHIRQDLVFDKNTGTLIGFVSLGEINSRLLAFEFQHSHMHIRMFTYTNDDLQWVTSLQYPYAQFPCNQACGDLWFNHFWEAVFHLD